MLELIRHLGGPAIAACLLFGCDPSSPSSTDAGRDAAAEQDQDAELVDAADDAAADDAAAGDATMPVGSANYAFPCLTLGDREPTHEPTFEAIYLDIFCSVGCTDSYCHGARGGWGGLTMTTIDGAHAALVDQPPGDLVPVDGRETCRESKLLRVEPGAPERSLLYLKVTGAPPCGTAMPPPGSDRRALTADEQDQIREWIAQGAPLTAP